MSETTETPCHWEQVQRRWKWEWASYHPHATVYWTADAEGGTTGLLDEATPAASPPDVVLDHAYGSRWEPVSGTGRDVVLATAELPEGVEPSGPGWRLVLQVG